MKRPKIFEKKVTLWSPDGKRKVKIPNTDRILTEKEIKKILKKSGISEEEFEKALEAGELEEQSNDR